ncbi:MULTISPECIES: hypothetical protein [Persicobacter]|uniref:DUF4105 domain-containing protein n=1 Tax=Persicobacter diffluens TaxID=981 RepID=A0AAN5ALR1_9BACT|nr:hypothetical protein [Persicobacter sp. CCB-QB2]GJM61138.1 hypothetical protein PEDI_16900 [Persicobacter diffluens]
MINKLLLFVFFFSFNLCLQAQSNRQFPSEMWHLGELVLLNGDTLAGALKYDFGNDAVLINAENRIRTFSSRKILYFEIYDSTVEDYREFFSIPYRVRSNYKIPVLFEVLHEGPLTLMSREEIVQETLPQYNYGYYGYNQNTYYSTQRKLSYDYYYLDIKGKVMFFDFKKKTLLHIMRRYSNEIKRFVKDNRLKYNDRNDLIRITDYYNELASGDKKAKS